MGIVLQLARIATGALGGAGFTTGLALSFDDKRDTVTVFVALYGGAALFTLLFVVLWVVIERRNKRPPSPSPTPKRIGAITRPSGHSDLSHAQFGSKLDVGLENEGDTDASEARFGVEDFNERELPGPGDENESEEKR